MSLLERDPGAPSAWPGVLPVTSRYTAGLAGERFFRALKDEGRILGAQCERCDITYVPARVFCERCLAPLDAWVDVGLIGEVRTFTLLFENVDGSRRDEPTIVAFVDLGDGGLVHTVEGVDPEDVFIGMIVEAELAPPHERTGSILDIRCFRPVG